MDNKIKPHLVTVLNEYGESEVRHICDGLCEHCRKSEGVQIGNCILCTQCFETLVKEVF